MLPKSVTHPNGEDSFRTEIAQLNWVTAGTPIEGTLYAVDDGCRSPGVSGTYVAGGGAGVDSTMQGKCRGGNCSPDCQGEIVVM